MDKRHARRGRGLVAVTLVALLAQGVWACAPTGYIKADDLETSGRGPSGCIKSCEELGMRMTALVLVGNSIPGCVCQPLTVQGVPPPPGAPPAGPPAANATGQVDGGAAASTTGYVVLAAAAAARQQQEQQRMQAQQHQNK